MKTNPFAARLDAFRSALRARKLPLAAVCGEANIRALTGITCDNAILLVRAKSEPVFYTDFRYVPMVHRTAPWMAVEDIAAFSGASTVSTCRAAGFESSMPYARWQRLAKAFPRAQFADILDDLSALRAVKTPEECARLRAAERLNDEIWSVAKARFRPGMTELDMARIIRHLMIDRGEGEAFETIVCIGKNAAECHHVPDKTVWNGRAPILVDMGVKLDGYCSDMTRNIVPPRPSRLYAQVYKLVLEANLRAIDAAKPGMTTGELDAVARDFLSAHNFGAAFGHALGHGVGLEIHEAPTARKGDKTVLRPGMSLTIEPGVYLEGNLGVRIEDLVLITETGCEVLSHSDK